ncbi:MAG: hypothetical protein K6F09_00120 [Clostridiales bacterium]|nr:hypothetical protein [Clostridiales bacterium]
MEKIISSDILDLMPNDCGFIYAEENEDEEGKQRVAFFAYDQDKNEIYPITIKAYLNAKLGEKFKDVAAELGDFLNCDTAIMPDGSVIALYDTGEMHVFNPLGASVWQGNITYQDEPVRALAVDGKCVWCAVPDRNAIVCYSPSEGRVLLRIGGGSTSAFSYPVSVSLFDGTLYVCNKNTNKIRTIHLEDYSVKDYMVFKEPVLGYFKTRGVEYVKLDSGVYRL